MNVLNAWTAWPAENAIFYVIPKNSPVCLRHSVTFCYVLYATDIIGLHRTMQSHSCKLYWWICLGLLQQVKCYIKIEFYNCANV